MEEALQQPALETPSGVISQFPTTHSDEQAWYYVCATLSTVVPGTLLLLRLYTKLSIVRRVDLTDYLTVFSFFFLIGIIVLGRLCISEGAGVHQWNLPMHNFIRMLYLLYVVQIVYGPTIFLVKTAILLQYLRLFAPQKTINPFMWYSARIIIVLTGIFYTISSFITMFACSPREASWNPLITDAKCLHNNTLTLITAAFNIVSDIAILILPARGVWKLRIPTRKKVGIVLLFALGLLACVANVMLIIYVSRVEGENADVSYNTAWQGLSAYAEISFGIIVTCTFTLPKFIEVKGTKVRGILSSLMRPFTSLRSNGFFGNFMQSKKDSTGSQEVTLDTFNMMGHSESNLPLNNRDQDTERYPSDESADIHSKYPSFNSTDTYIGSETDHCALRNCNIAA